MSKSSRLSLVFLCCLAIGCGAAKPQLVDLRQEAVRLNDEGYQYYRESRWRLAENKFNEALKLNRLIDCRPGIASNLNNLGAIAQEQGKLADAEKYYRDALTIQLQNGDGAGICEALNNLGTVLAAQGRWAEAGNLYQQALGYAQSLRPGPLQALTLMHQGDVARHQKHYQQALDLYQQALAIANDPAAYVQSLQEAGYATDPQYAEKVLAVMDSPALSALKLSSLSSLD